MTARYATQAAALTAIVKARQLISAGKVETDSWEHNRKYGGGWSAAIRFGDIRISTANDDRWRGAYSPVGSHGFEVTGGSAKSVIDGLTAEFNRVIKNLTEQTELL